MPENQRDVSGKIWKDYFDTRAQKQIEFSRIYFRDFGHGADGHNNMLIIARMAELLDIAYGIGENDGQRENNP